MSEIRRNARVWPVVLLLVALLAIGGIIVTALHAVVPQTSGRAACRVPLTGDSALQARAADTIGRIRGVRQRATRGFRDPTGYTVRTEDTSATDIHDGGLVHFDCARRVEFIWLDGG